MFVTEEASFCLQIYSHLRIMRAKSLRLEAGLEFSILLHLSTGFGLRRPIIDRFGQAMAKAALYTDI
jgi:hypothetical protein